MGKKHHKTKIQVSSAFTSGSHATSNPSSATAAATATGATKPPLSVTEKLNLLRRDDAAHEARLRRERAKAKLKNRRDGDRARYDAHGNLIEGPSSSSSSSPFRVDDEDDGDDAAAAAVVTENLAKLDLNAATMPSVPPVIREVLNLGEVPALGRLGGTRRRRWTGHRRLGNGAADDVSNGAGEQGTSRARAAPGPPPPKSWVTDKYLCNRTGRWKVVTGEGYGPRQWRWRQQRQRQQLVPSMCRTRDNSSRFECYMGLDHLSWRRQSRHSPERLSCMVARRIAQHWDELLEVEQYNLATLPARLKALILGNVVLYGPDVVTIRTLQVLFLNRAELANATGAEEMKELNLSTLVGGGGRWTGLTLRGLLQKVIMCGRIHEEDEAFPVLLTSSSPLSAKGIAKGQECPRQHDPTPESWDDEEEDDDDDGRENGTSITKPLITTRFANLTHLSLARPQFRYPSIPWSDLLALTKHLPTITHLSLAYWPTPTLTPNSRTAYVSPNPKYAGAPPLTGPASTAIPLGGTHFYSAMDDDWSEAAGILRRLSANTYCLKYLDVEGCSEWWSALVWPVKKRDGHRKGGGDPDGLAEGNGTGRASASTFKLGKYWNVNHDDDDDDDEWSNYSASCPYSTHSAHRQNSNSYNNGKDRIFTAGVDWTGPWREVGLLQLSHCGGTYYNPSDPNPSSTPQFTFRSKQMTLGLSNDVATTLATASTPASASATATAASRLAVASVGTATRVYVEIYRRRYAAGMKQVQTRMGSCECISEIFLREKN